MRYDVNENHMLQEVDEPEVSHYLVKLRVTDKEGFEIYNLVVEADYDVEGVVIDYVAEVSNDPEVDYYYTVEEVY